jgi:hypothetical protein
MGTSLPVAAEPKVGDVVVGPVAAAKP